MPASKYILTLSMLFLLSLTALSNSADVELGNLVLNKTITRVGHEFFDAFSERWYPMKNIAPVHIRISEVPSARWGSILSVWVGQELYFRTRLSSRARNTDEVAEQAVQQVMITLAARSIQQQQEGMNGDLVGDGL